MESTLQEEAHKLINQIIELACKELNLEFSRSNTPSNNRLDDAVSTISSESRATYKELERANILRRYKKIKDKGPNIAWISCEDFTIEKGKEQINDYVKTWKYENNWLYCIDFLKEDDHPYNRLFRYRVLWSVPTRRKPIPRATAAVYFTICISKIKPKTLPIEVYFIFESNKLVHRPGEVCFREKWLKDIISSKLILTEQIRF